MLKKVILISTILALTSTVSYASNIGNITFVKPRHKISHHHRLKHKNHKRRNTTKHSHHTHKIKKADINSIDQNSLAKIRGVGKRRAKAIIGYRNQHGKFKALNDLLQIGNKKIDAKFIAKMHKHLKVTNSIEKIT